MLQRKPQRNVHKPALLKSIKSQGDYVVTLKEVVL